MSREPRIFGAGPHLSTPPHQPCPPCHRGVKVTYWGLGGVGRSAILAFWVCPFVEGGGG